MRRSSSLKHRIRRMEEGQGAGAVNLEFSDGSTRALSLRRKDRLKVLIASFDLAHEAGNQDAKPSATSRAIETARLIGMAERITPVSRTLETIRGIVKMTQEKCTLRAPDPASASFPEVKERTPENLSAAQESEHLLWSLMDDSAPGEGYRTLRGPHFKCACVARVRGSGD
ncbi:MAG: hypothetical protein ABSH39_02885 [Candidatus Acidiferrum sp.]|jgi:hypothetical protein